MEKAHNWVYVRQKTNGNGTKSEPTSVNGCGDSRLTDISMSPVEHPMSYNALTPPDDSLQKFDHLVDFDFPSYPTDQCYMQLQGDIPLELDDLDLELSTIPQQTLEQFEVPSPSWSSSSYSSSSSSSSSPSLLAATTLQNGTLQNGSDVLFDQNLSRPPIHHLPPYTQQDAGMHVPLTFQTHPLTPPQNSYASLSPGADGNTMLFTPTSINDATGCMDMNMAFNDAHVLDDFCLFPVQKLIQPGLLFDPVMPFFPSQESPDLFPSLDLDPHQQTQNEIMFDWSSSVDQAQLQEHHLHPAY
jgi:hypothetical protein